MKEHQIDYLIGDTAGRLQNKANLMKELEKMRRVIAVSYTHLDVYKRQVLF